jgi:hypothetical protein
MTRRRTLARRHEGDAERLHGQSTTAVPDVVGEEEASARRRCRTRAGGF